MNDIFAEMLKQAPIAAVFGAALWIVYNDWKADRAVANQQREAMIEQLTLNTVYIQLLATKLGVPLPDRESALSGLHRTDVT